MSFCHFVHEDSQQYTKNQNFQQARDDLKAHHWCDHGKQTLEIFQNGSKKENCIVKKLLLRDYPDFTASSESDEDRYFIDGNKMYPAYREPQNIDVFMPGTSICLAFPKMSGLSRMQHLKCLSIFNADNPNMLNKSILSTPTSDCYRVLEKVKIAYENEQDEFRDWAKGLWAYEINCAVGHFSKLTASFYEAEFRIKALQMHLFPKEYQLRLTMLLPKLLYDIDIDLKKELVKVDMSQLKQLEKRMVLEDKLNILDTELPEVCLKHSNRMSLPRQSLPSTLPMYSVYRHLGKYAVDNGVDFIASEEALKCLVRTDENWTIFLTRYIKGTQRCIVIGEEVVPEKEFFQKRTHRVFKRCLKQGLLARFGVENESDVASSEADIGASTSRTDLSAPCEPTPSCSYAVSAGAASTADMGASTSRTDLGAPWEPTPSCSYAVSAGAALSAEGNEPTVEENQDNASVGAYLLDLQIKEGDESTEEENQDNASVGAYLLDLQIKDEEEEEVTNAPGSNHDTGCTCIGNISEPPPPRSFKTWTLKNEADVTRDFIVHCAHEFRDQDGELVLEPIPEFQIGLGASQLSEGAINSMTLSLLLRQKASVVIARVDAYSGEVVKIDKFQWKTFSRAYGNRKPEVLHIIANTLDMLAGIDPGMYLLKHEANKREFKLYHVRSGLGSKITLDFDTALDEELDEVSGAITPTLAPVLLPIHVKRRILPCAFSPYFMDLTRLPKRPFDLEICKRKKDTSKMKRRRKE